MKKTICILALAALFLAGCSGKTKKAEAEATEVEVVEEQVAAETDSVAAEVPAEVDSVANVQ
jgi:PBP1b-binding outer membrane lipoprotein LpoB